MHGYAVVTVIIICCNQRSSVLCCSNNGCNYPSFVPRDKKSKEWGWYCWDALYQITLHQTEHLSKRDHSFFSGMSCAGYLCGMFYIFLEVDIWRNHSNIQFPSVLWFSLKIIVSVFWVFEESLYSFSDTGWNTSIVCELMGCFGLLSSLFPSMNDK